MSIFYKLFNTLSLTCAFILCISAAEARRMSPQQYEIMQQREAAKKASVAPPQSQRVWQAQVNDLATWQQLSKPARDYQFSKFVIDIKTGQVYYLDANVFALHSDFVLDYLQKIPRTAANVKQYNRNYSNKKPNFILGYITHYPKLNEWTFSFWEGDTIDVATINKTAKKLKATFKVANLKFRPDSSYQERVALGLKKYRIPIIKNSQIYKSQPYQAFNTGVAVGRLNIVPIGTAPEKLQFEPDEIVVLQETYPDISPVAGIITIKPSTPLAHVNLRAAAWGIPNAYDIDAAFFEELYFTQKNSWMKLEVTEQKLTLTAATAQEIAVAQIKTSKKKIELPQADLSTTTLAPLSEINLKNITRYGAKTAHLGAMYQARLPVPNGFGIPFYYYQQHIAASRMDIGLQSMLNNPQFKQNKVWRKQQLLAFQAQIKSAPMNSEHFSAIKQQWKAELQNAPVFVRSSTNAEDLAGFNGAGLYDTVPNVTDNAALEAAIKQVWASLWNERAVNEREFFGIAQDQVYASVLIQTAVNANAAGVLLTTDIWGHQPRTFTINAKWGLGMRVVEGQKIAEQILYDTTNNGTRVISRSDETTMLVADKKGGIKAVKVPKTEAIISEQRAKNLSDLVLKVETLFPQYTVLDIEWVLEKDYLGRDKFWLVQSRPYVVNKKKEN
jgi:Pyruvate phosphate dikinase, AMP/ATP-binding domain